MYDDMEAVCATTRILAQVISQGCTYTVSVDVRAEGRAEVVVRQAAPEVIWSGSFTASCEYQAGM